MGVGVSPTSRQSLPRLTALPSTFIPNNLYSSLVSLLHSSHTRSANHNNSCWQFQTNKHSAVSSFWTISYLHTTLRKKIFYCYLPFVEWSVLGAPRTLSRGCLRFYLHSSRMPSRKEQHCIVSSLDTEMEFLWAGISTTVTCTNPSPTSVNNLNEAIPLSTYN